MNISYLKYARVGLNYLLKKQKLPAGKILGLTIEPTNICNLRCVYCPQSRPEEHFVHGKGSMSFEDYKKILDNILSDFQPEFVSLHRDGEPLLHRNLEKFISYTVSRGLKTLTSSNCTLLDRSRSESLLKAGLSLIKTDFCADRELYERLRVGASWEKTYNGMINILELAQRWNIPFRINITDISTYEKSTREKRKNIKELERLFKAYKSRIHVGEVYFHNSLGESKEAFGSDPPAEGKRYILCHHPWVHIVVDFRGNVVSCCRDLRSEYIIGNLLEDRMVDIWNNRKFMFLRKALIEKEIDKISTCRKCDLPYGGSYSGSSFINKAFNLIFSDLWKR